MATTREAMLQRELAETRNTLQRQRLLKELWRLERARQAEEAGNPIDQIPVVAALPIAHGSHAVGAPVLIPQQLPSVTQ